MKKFGPALGIFIVLLVLSIIYTVYKDSILERISKIEIPYITELQYNGSITITSPNGSLDIFIDDELYGSGNQNITNLASGRYNIKLARTNGDQSIYTPRGILIDVLNNTESIVNLELLPFGYMHGYTIYYSEIFETEQSRTVIISEPDDLVVEIDGIIINNRIINLSEGEHTLKAKHPDFEPIEFKIYSRPKMQLNISIYLAPITQHNIVIE